MRSKHWNRGTLAVAFVAMALSLAVSTGRAHASAHPAATEVERPVATDSARRSDGLLGWLESLLPRGMRFQGPIAGAKNQPQVLATANCYDSGAGFSCSGFKSLEDYMAAVHASQNLGIPFDKLKERLQTGRSLQEAIRDLRPGTNYKSEARKAEFQAQKSLRDFPS